MDGKLSLYLLNNLAELVNALQERQKYKLENTNLHSDIKKVVVIDASIK